MKRWLPYVGIFLGVVLAGYALFFNDSDEDRIRARLQELELTVGMNEAERNILFRLARVKKAFSEIFIKQVTYDLPELHAKERGRTRLAALAANAPRLYRTVRVDLGELNIKVDASRSSAAAYGKAVLIGERLSGQPQRDARTVSFRFDKVEGSWRIVSVIASPPER
jgi:hypothetical protein